jgi:hypothetical protein
LARLLLSFELSLRTFKNSFRSFILTKFLIKGIATTKRDSTPLYRRVYFSTTSKKKKSVFVFRFSSQITFGLRTTSCSMLISQRQVIHLSLHVKILGSASSRRNRPRHEIKTSELSQSCLKKLIPMKYLSCEIYDNGDFSFIISSLKRTNIMPFIMIRHPLSYALSALEHHITRRGHVPVKILMPSSQLIERKSPNKSPQ